MSARRRHGAGPPPRDDGRAGTSPSKAERRHAATERRKAIGGFLTAHPGALFVPERSCGKTRYASASAAESALAVIVRYRDRGGRIPFRVYVCPDCGGWHLTSWSSPDAPPPR